MSPEDRSLLERTYKMAEENNSLLLSLRRHARMGTAIKVVYWIVILGLSFGAYYFIQPFITAITGTVYNNENSTSTNTNGLGNIENTISQIQDLLK